MKPDELLMSDLPWAVAWYGQRQCVWLTLRVSPDAEDRMIKEDFFVINDYLKPIRALYLTPLTIDRRFITEWFRSGEYTWGSFLLQTFVEKRVPQSFPLGNAAQLPYTPQVIKPEVLQKRINLVDQQVANLGQLAHKLLENEQLRPLFEGSSSEEARLLEEVITLAQGREFPLDSAPVASTRGLEQMILRGQLVLTDRPRW